MHAQDAEFGEPLGSLMVVVFPIELRGTLVRQGELPLVVGKVGRLHRPLAEAQRKLASSVAASDAAAAEDSPTD